MSEIKSPKSIEQITPDWMTPVLRQATGSAQVTVGRLKIESLGGEGRGFLSGVARVTLAYEGPAEGAPDSVVVKLPTTQESGREVALDNGAYLRELRFYREIAPQSPIRVPACYFTSLDPAAEDYLLVMEDARDWRAGDQVAGLSLDQAEAALRAIARFHARWWDLAEPAELDWVPREVSHSFRLFAQSWPGFRDRHGDLLSARARRDGARIAGNLDALAGLLAAGRQTLAHCDFRADNLMFTGAQGAERVMVLDWQWLTRTIGAYDVARLVCGSLPTRLGHGNHRSLVGIWHDALSAAGVADYGLEAAWADYQTGLLQYSYVPVVCADFFSHEGGRSRALLHAMIDRAFHAITECNAVERLGQA